MKRYRISEIFYSLQGEGARAGAPSVFVRFAGCNLQCTRETVGFDCDTDHRERLSITAEEIADAVNDVNVSGCNWIVFTGGEPLLQLDTDLIDALFQRTMINRFAIETNGTLTPDAGVLRLLSHVACSPKRGRNVVLAVADEVRIVLPPGEEPPDKPPLMARRWYISPAWSESHDSIDWAISQCLRNPRWSLSVQQHKLWGIR
jgi:7-carboxy-7-deazaguanine synthase